MTSDYKVTIGLEVHAELATKTKMFCASKNDPDEKRPNVNICPVCMGYPGTLPVINKAAVKHVIKMGTAVGGKIADFTEFDRKNYFYPDIPKGYQISQYKYPLVSGGALAGVALTRIHLEEDTARSTHEHDGFSLVDYNRAGVPLMELVTEPVIHDAETAVRFAKELQLLLQCLGAGEANMEKGEMRVEANISVSKTEKFGTKVEVKNLNSFRAVERAIAYEVNRHIGLLESGKPIVQETRGWDENKQSTFSQRAKEDSHDYRYFPDPDLPKLYISEVAEFSADAIKKELPELPWEKRDRFIKTLKLKPEDAEMYVGSMHLAQLFEKTISFFSNDEKKIQLASNYITSDLSGLLKNEKKVEEVLSKFSSDAFAKLITMTAEGKIGSRGAKDILAILYKEGGDPEKIADEKGLIQKSDPEALKKMVSEIITENPTVVTDFKAGKAVALQFLVGQGMKKSKGSANPAILRQLFEENLK